MNIRFIIGIIIILILIDIVTAMVCKTDYEDKDYLKCLEWRKERIKECEDDPDCAGICDELEDGNYSSCLVISECNPPQKCQSEFGEGEPPVEQQPICSTCPPACKLKDPNDTCGECICPENHGFCTHEVGVRKIINNTSIYCIDGLWLQQKEDNQTCQNSFECISNFCSKDFCYDISKQVEENKSLLNSILDWIKKFFRI